MQYIERIPPTGTRDVMHVLATMTSNLFFSAFNNKTTLPTIFSIGSNQEMLTERNLSPECLAHVSLLHVKNKKFGLDFPFDRIWKNTVCIEIELLM